ncbi:YMGG-like glycine zipper-containing protein [Sulfurovum sp. XGS-02]|uniref:YMGG-like glycine zipper-containing protein n=1 Tax=Sulfurovum sp. XGS-02 TaxID=2925411 RepID=UPI002064FDCA|nr:YMGG-like glycine zipper-containing protein [Sulfurovum sp. XGS-02]UPT77540.1 YMGG-like glycine zipper-containing protein [Sulfurovum sp. XGS-02]
MKRNILKFMLASTASMILLNGCTGSEVTPNNATQTGAATGAVAGAVIGYNTGSGGGKNAAVGALIGTALGAGIGSAVDSQNPEPVETGGWQ